MKAILVSQLIEWSLIGGRYVNEETKKSSVGLYLILINNVHLNFNRRIES